MTTRSVAPELSVVLATDAYETAPRVFIGETDSYPHPGIRDHVRLPRWIVPGVLGVSAIQAAGEAVGYAGPSRRAGEQMQEYELHKLRHVGLR